MKKSKISNALNCYLWITIGSVIYAIGFDWLYVPNGIGFGGITSLGHAAFWGVGAYTAALLSTKLGWPFLLTLLAACVEIIPLQLLAYYVARENGCDIDKPKNLAKSVTVE